MVQNVRADELALTGDRKSDNRLSPAEAHGMLRRQVGLVAARWGLKPSDVHQVTRQSHIHTYNPGEIIVPRGAHADCLGLIVRGQVAVHIGQRKTARTVVILLPGSAFGEAMLLEGQPSHTTLQALTRCEIWFVRRSDLQVLADARRSERQVTVLWQLVGTSLALLALMLLAVLLVSLSPTRKAIALLPMALGQVCRQADRAFCAEQAWTVAANLAPADANPHLALGTLYYQRGGIGAAEQSFEKAKALDPNSPEAANNLGLIYARQGQHERAIAAFREALELEPGAAAIEHNLGLSLQAIHNYDEALNHYQAALALGEPQIGTLLNMALAYYEAGQLEEARDAAQIVLLRDETLAPAHAVLGAVALESQQPEEALLHLQRAVALDAGYGQAYFYLGLAHKVLGQPAEAIGAFERALTTAADEVTRVRIRRHLNELYEEERQSSVP
jgi:tetratricopeptide (TPR) repeat protein